MAIKKKKLLEEKAPEYLLHTCGECEMGVPDTDHSNLDYQGRPICLTCPYETKRKRIRSERACDKWKPKK